MANIAELISNNSELFPHKKAVIHPQKKGALYEESSMSFLEFENRSNQIAHKLKLLGIKKGERVLLFIKPKIDFPIITFALFKIGAIPILIDPGMGVKRVLNSVKQVAPHYMIAEKAVFLIKCFRSDFFQTIKLSFTPQELVSDLVRYPKSKLMESVEDSDVGCILFTSGGTGIPKGVVTTHGILRKQTELLQKMFSLTPDDVDLPGFGLFSLFTLSMGMTSIIPDMDPTRPSLVDPKKLIPILLKYGVTFAAGSPAIWERVGRFAHEHQILFPSLKYVTMFGAPVRGELHQCWAQLLPEGTTYTPYGATEALPLTLMSGREVLNETYLETKKGKGVCVGKPIQDIEIKILKITNDKLDSLPEVSTGEVGEIVVSGPIVTRLYFGMKEETEKAKIMIGHKLWHRMGDVGYLDHEGRLWFLGRKVHVVEMKQNNYYPIALEAMANQLPKVKRSALIGLIVKGEKKLAMVLELHDKESLSLLEKQQYLKWLRSQSLTQEVSEIFIKKRFPTDVRHQIKIDRLLLQQEFQKRYS